MSKARGHVDASSANADRRGMAMAPASIVRLESVGPTLPSMAETT
jgi:hypothetical protein